MTIADVPFYRLYNQRLTGSKFTTAAEVVKWLGAVQAQDYPGALWSVGLRMRQATEASVEKAVTDRKIVRTWPMRGTLHFVAPEDVRWMLELLARRVISKFASYYLKVGLTDQVLAKSHDLLEKVLRGGKQLTRPELYKILEENKIPTQAMRGLFILGNLAMNGFLIFGARQGKQQTFTLLEEWIPPAKSLSREEALANLVRRYFTSHGPATIQDLMWWSGLTTAEVKAGLSMVKSDLRQEEIEGAIYWRSPGRTGKNASPTSYLLQGYDEYTIAYKDRSAVADPDDLRKAAAKNMVFGNSIVTNGRVVGFWRRTIKKKVIEVKMIPFSAFSRTQKKAVENAARRYADFLKLPLEFGE